MTDEEIIAKLTDMQIKEKINQKQLAKMIGLGITHLNRILGKKQRICPHRRRIFEMVFKMYDAGLLK